jgi:Maltose operon periplasmic protein precursor (MalM)
MAEQPMRATKLAVAACVLLAVCGCAPTSLALRDSLVAAPDCCASERDFSYQALDMGERVKAELGAASPAHEFSSGKSYYAAFRLPPQPRPLNVQVRSVVSGGLTLAEAYLFYPVVAILDADHRVRSVVAVPPEKVDSSVQDDMFAGVLLDLTVPVAEGDVFVVLYTDARLLGKTFRFERHTTTTRTVYYPGGSMLVTDPVYVQADIPYAAGGRVEVRLVEPGSPKDNSK